MGCGVLRYRGRNDTLGRRTIRAGHLHRDALTLARAAEHEIKACSAARALRIPPAEREEKSSAGGN